jgi:hypothetical protein
MSKIQPGDVFKIETQKGKAYMQYCCLGNNGIEFIRVLEGLYSEKPLDVSEIVSSKERYVVQFPVASAKRKKLIFFVGNFPMPKHFAKPRYMRSSHIAGGEFVGWHIVDTDTLQRKPVSELSFAERKLSPWGIWNDTILREHLEGGWSLDNWVK